MIPTIVAWLSSPTPKDFPRSCKHSPRFHKPTHTISSILKKPKDKIEKEASRGIVYKINCKDCDCVYVGQTSRSLKTRMKEHAKAIATSDKNS